MQGIRPERLSDEEFLRYAPLAMTAQGLPVEWAQEAIRRIADLRDMHVYGGRLGQTQESRRAVYPHALYPNR